MNRDDEMNRTTVAFTGKQKEQIEAAVIEIIIQSKQKTTFSEVVHTCVKNYLEEAVKDIKEKRKN